MAWTLLYGVLQFHRVLTLQFAVILGLHEAVLQVIDLQEGSALINNKKPLACKSSSHPIPQTNMEQVSPQLFLWMLSDSGPVCVLNGYNMLPLGEGPVLNEGKT